MGCTLTAAEPHLPMHALPRLKQRVSDLSGSPPQQSFVAYGVCAARNRAPPTPSRGDRPPPRWKLLLRTSGRRTEGQLDDWHRLRFARRTGPRYSSHAHAGRLDAMVDHAMVEDFRGGSQPPFRMAIIRRHGPEKGGEPGLNAQRR